MKKFLFDFFERFDYPAKARMELTDAYQSITDHTEASARWNAMIEEYLHDIDCDFSAQIKSCRQLSDDLLCSDFTLKLLLFICHAKHLRTLYEQKGIEEQVWYDSMLDLKAKLMECYEIYGVWGTFVADWFPGFFQLKRFTLGRLQFEPIPFKKTYEKNGLSLNEDSVVLNVHIPRTLTPLDPVSCDTAYRQASKFFAPMLNGAPCVFVCQSWLLFPEHETILPPHSNLRSFMANYDIISWRYYDNDNSQLWRLFDTMERRPDRLPANTSLRRAYIDHLMRGGKTGWGYGVYCPQF